MKVIKGIAVLAGALLVMFGLIICMCETPELDKQISTMLYGFGTMVAGAVICFIGNGGLENVSESIG